MTVNPHTPKKNPDSFRKLRTPEGIELDIELASIWDRVIALTLDLFFIVASFFIMITLLISLGTQGADSNVISMLFLLGYFFLKTFYFMFFELRWRGKTPGKRIMNLRVVDSSGAALGERSIFARNLMREIEVFLPLLIFLSVLFSDEIAASEWFYLLWTAIFIALPMLHENRMRAGDMIAGTWVVKIPNHALGKDIAGRKIARPVQRKNAPSTVGNLVFTDAQLEKYGIFELQTLEKVLRSNHVGNEKAKLEISQRIKKKIDWYEPDPKPSTEVFLQAFYDALRQQLEGRMLMGDRRENKFSAQKSKEADSR